MIKVNVPGEGVFNFPDNMSKADIKTALDKHFSSSKKNNTQIQDEPSYLSQVAQSIKNIPGDVWAGIKNREAAAAGAAHLLFSDIPLSANRVLTGAVNEAISPFTDRRLKSPQDPLSYLTQYQQKNPRAYAGGQDLLGLGLPEAKVAEGLTGAVLNPAATGALYSGLMGGGVSDSAKAGALGATLGALTHSAPIALAGASKIAKGNVPQEIINARLASIPEGAKPSIGDITGNKTAQYLYHDLAGGIPFSNAQNNTRQFVDLVRGHVGDIANSLKGDSTEASLASDIADSVKSAANETRGKAQRLYNLRNKLADNKNLKFDETPSLNEYASSKLKEIENKPEKFLTTLNESTINDLEKINKSPDLDKKSFDYSLQNAHNFRSDLMNKARDLNRAGDKANAAIYETLANKLDEDIRSKIKSSGADDVLKAHDEAQKYYKENRVPFVKNREILNILDDKYNEKNIHNPLVQIKNKDVLKNLSDADKGKILYSALKNSLSTNELGNLEANPLPLVNKYNTLDAAARKRLVTPEIDEKISKLKSLGQVASEPFKQAANAYTGGRNIKDALRTGYSGNIIGHAYSGNIPGAIGAAVFPPIGANLLARTLTNRNQINRLLTEQSRPISAIESIGRLAKNLQSSETPLISNAAQAAKTAAALSALGLTYGAPRMAALQAENNKRKRKNKE